MPPATAGRSLTSVPGFQSQVLLRWRLCPGDWRLEGTSVLGPLATLQIHCDQPITRLELVAGWESMHYGTKTPLPVVEVNVVQSSGHHSPLPFSSRL